MCGILGLINGEDMQVHEFSNALSMLEHRGPDSINFLNIKQVWLGHTRLKILDVSEKANQPFSSECGNIYIVFNGEIYNFKMLRSGLFNYNFRTTSDTEVILAAYLAYGAECFSKFNGMFSIAIYDKNKNILLLARDKIGKKPLFYWQRNNSFAFASEIQPLRKIINNQCELSAESINEYFARGFIGGRHTIYTNIKQVLPGECLKLNLQSPLKLLKYRYHSQDGSRLKRVEVPQIYLSEAIIRLDELLTDSCALRLQSDVPVGVFLSGGLDSSLITSIVAGMDDTLKTFSVSFPKTSSDEFEYAKRLSTSLNLENIPIFMDYENVDTLLYEIISRADQPFADSSLLPTFMISRVASNEVKVVLTGDGGDELFSGYAHYDHFASEYDLRKKIPAWTLTKLGALSSLLPDRQKFRLLKSLKSKSLNESMAKHSSRFFDVKDRSKLLMHNICSDRPEEHFYSLLADYTDWIDAIAFADIQTYLVDDILVKLDRASMYNSLEARSPLLDERIINFATHELQADQRRFGSVRKYILKQLGKKYLPKDYDYERKHGFGVPLNQWMKKNLGIMLNDYIESANRSPVINVNYVKDLIAANNRGFSNYSKKLYSVLVWEIWYQEAHLNSR